MSVEVTIIDGPLPAAPSAAAVVDGAGAVVVFEGIVRAREGDGVIEALEYQAYEPMAQRQMGELAGELVARHGLLRVRVEHSRGRVGVGECSFRLVIESPHRAEALAAMGEFIDRLKRDVPIWKRPVWRAGPRPAPPTDSTIAATPAAARSGHPSA